MEEGGERNQMETFRLILSLFLLFLLVSPGNDKESDNLRDTEEVKRMKEVKRLLNEKLDIDYRSFNDPLKNYAYNISGIYLGKWNRSSEGFHLPDHKITLSATQEINRLHSNSSIHGNDGLLSLQLYDHSQYRENINIVKAAITIIEGEQDSSEDSFSLNLVGLYFVKTGHLVLYGNTYGSRLHLDWNSTLASSHLVINNSFSSLIGYSINGTNRIYLSQPMQFMNQTTSRCFFKLSMQIASLPKGIDPEISHHPHNHYIVNGTGLLESENCPTRLQLEMGGYNLDTNHINTKSRWYTLIMMVVSFVECILYIKLLQNLVATSSSLMMIFCISSIDLLMAMIHSLVGIFFMGILSDLYVISFHKFFVFSVVEMRLLYVVWSVRHPDINNDNIRMLQRQLTSIFAGLYILVIAILIFFYLNRTVFYCLIFVIYSFWLPQIIRSLQVGQRAPFSNKQILWITLLKLSIPSYLFICPYNIIAMFTEIHIPYRFGYLLVFWILVQVWLKVFD